MDVVIIGGGPAGITAGVVLQKQGHNTCIIDNHTFPREKLCAGVITTKAVKLIQHIYDGLDLNSLEINYINKISMFYKDKIISNYIVKNPYGVVNRSEFDNALLNYYKALGGTVFENQKSYHILYDKNIVKLTNGKKLKYRCLIGADGINSKVRTYVQHKWKTSILCFETFIANSSKESTIKIYFGNVLGGYCWRIPGQNRIGIGLGEFYMRRRKRSITKYANYFHEQGVDDLSKVKGAFVSSGYFVKNPVKNNVILIGDAAGLVDAMSGEGIFFAIESGRQAALTINDFFKHKSPLSKYVKRIRRIHKKMREQSKFNKLLYIPIFQKICIKHIKNNPLFAQRILDDAMSSYKSGYIKELLKNWRDRKKCVSGKMSPF